MTERIFGCTGKRKYATREMVIQINEHIREQRLAKRMHAYQCQHCGCWHASTQSPKEFRRRARTRLRNRRLGRMRKP